MFAYGEREDWTLHRFASLKINFLKCILVGWKRGSSTAQSIVAAESEAKIDSQISNFPTFLLYIGYELLLRSLRSLRSNKKGYSQL